MLICVNPKEYKLTKYKRYEKVGEAENRIIIRNDNGKRASYAPDFFRNVNVNVLTNADFPKIAMGRTQIVNIETGQQATAVGMNNGEIIPGTANNTTWALNNIVFAHKLGLCSNDEFVPPPPKVLLKDIKSHLKKGIKYKDKPYIVKALNGRSSVILMSRIDNKEKRVSAKELLNNENCYEG